MIFTNTNIALDTHIKFCYYRYTVSGKNGTNSVLGITLTNINV